ncbi:macrophage mannose receptor 1-like [Anticarsia gemmatalis]|uniref:macrophage mannose receptor 1-like n=1 Tax=Anticarsia gemmatalis TaxID=129554 RepID=UPI003F76762B
MSIKVNCLILLCFGVACLDAVKFRCDYDFHESGWYKYHKIPALLVDARWMCQFEGGILASPTTDEIRKTMQSYTQSSVLTGMYALSHGHFRSIDGIKLDEMKHNWAPNEPDNHKNVERCMSMNANGQISDVTCEVPLPYICFRANSSVDVNECGTPDSAYHFEKRTNKCYKFHTKPRSYEYADFVCSAEGGRIVSINSTEEAEIIRQLYAQYPNERMIGNFYKDRILVGFYKESYKFGADWKTQNGKYLEESGFSKFAPGEPSSESTENCGSMMRSGLLNDTPCDMAAPFVCEKTPNYPPVCDAEIKRYTFKEPATEYPIDLRYLSKGQL